MWYVVFTMTMRNKQQRNNATTQRPPFPTTTSIPNSNQFFIQTNFRISKMKLLNLVTLIIGASLLTYSRGFVADHQSQRIHDISLKLNRRSFVGATASTVGLLVATSPANAGIDPTLLQNLPVQGDVSGTSQRLRQIEAIQKPASDRVDIPFEELPSGVSYREYREGKGEAAVQPGSKVAVEMTIRCKSFSTANEPGGVKYYSTKDDTEFNELAWAIGSGELLPGLEEAMMGMHKNGLRRIEVPATQVFAARKADQLPIPTTKDGKRRFESLFKTEATLLFEVLVTRIK
jgi:FKBP-type peptidyl-prolyl cis-trans isomerase